MIVEVTGMATVMAKDTKNDKRVACGRHFNPHPPCNHAESWLLSARRTTNHMSKEVCFSSSYIWPPA